MERRGAGLVQVNAAVKLTSADVAKADAALRQRLDEAKPGDTVRVVMILDPSQTSGLSHESKVPKPTEFPDRVAYREALITKQKAAMTDSVGATIQSLKDLSLKVHGGEVTRAIVVEGAAKDLLASLGLPGVRSATLDQPLRTTRPRKRRK